MELTNGLAGFTLGTQMELRIDLQVLLHFLLPLVVLLGATFVLCWSWGGTVLEHLRRRKVGQTVREDGPQSHFVKSGTPTFGGLMFLPVLLLVGIMYCIRTAATERLDALVFLLAVAAFAGIGFADDYVKVRVSKAGLSVLQKSLPLLLVCTLVAIYVVWGRPGCFLTVPFSPYLLEVQGIWKILYALFLVVYLYFCTNAANLTDGVDGLLASVTCVSCIVVVPLSLVTLVPSWLLGWNVATVGACQGFLLFNRNPAKVFMGDVGSLALGGILCMTPVFLGMPWLFALLGLIYLLEALSVVLQVCYFKATGGKRIFRMSPIHHHFELGGWKEKQIVRRFVLVQAVFALVGFLWIALGVPR